MKIGHRLRYKVLMYSDKLQSYESLLNFSMAWKKSFLKNMEIPNDETVEIFNSNQGNLKICIHNYFYVKGKTNKSGISWVCAKRRYGKCPAALKTDFQIKNVLYKGEHNHESTPIDVEIFRFRHTIKQEARNTMKSISEILKANINKLSSEAKSKIGNLEIIRKDIRRQRKKIQKDKEFNPLKQVRITRLTCLYTLNTNQSV